MKTPCSPRRSNPRQTGLFWVYNHRGLNVQPSKSRINTKVSNLNTLYQNCSPKMQKGVAFVFFVGKYTLDRGGVPFRLAGGTEVAVRLKLAADAVGRHALKEKVGRFSLSFPPPQGLPPSCRQGLCRSRGIVFFSANEERFKTAVPI